jgi:tetratricopeptide (TPR) repeat protein
MQTNMLITKFLIAGILPLILFCAVKESYGDDYITKGCIKREEDINFDVANWIAQGQPLAEKEDCVGKDCCRRKPTSSYEIVKDKKTVTLSLHLFYKGDGYYGDSIEVYLSENNRCRAVLQTWGHCVRFIPKEKGSFPDIEVFWDTKTGETQPYPLNDWTTNYKTIFTWTGQKYEDAELPKSRSLNKQALALFKEGKIHSAISLWEKALPLSRIPRLGLTANAEVLNNLGFAYQKVGYDAEMYYNFALKVDSCRWVAHLNLGDLYAAGIYIDKELSRKAIDHYKKALSLNPGYKRAKEIKQKIKDLKNNRGKVIDERAQYIYKFKIRQDLPIISVKVQMENMPIEGDASYSLARRLIVSKDGRVIQEIDVDNSECERALDTKTYLTAEDINFDGYQDLKLLCWWGATGNEGFKYWLYDRKSGTFIYNSSFEGLSNPTPNSETHEICTHANMGSAGMQYSNECYKFIDDKLTLIRSVTQDGTVTRDGKTYFVKTTEELKNGEMIKVKEELIESPF